MKEGVLLLPVTIILTIPALRELYAGFASIWDNLLVSLRSNISVQGPMSLSDTFGFFVQMMLVATCSMTILFRRYYAVRARKRFYEAIKMYG